MTPRETLAELYSWIRDEEIPMSDRLGRICDRLEALASATLATPASQTPAEVPDMPAICAALGFDPTNHHNAAKCPYCRPALATTEQQAAALPVDEDKLEDMARGAFESAMAFGVSVDAFARLARDVARLATQAPEAAPQPTPQSVRYTSSMGAAADKYINDLGGCSSSLPAQFRWEECLATMLKAQTESKAEGAG